MGEPVLRSLPQVIVDVFHNIGKIAPENPAQGVQRVGGHGFPGLQPPDGGAADLALELERVGGGVLFSMVAHSGA